VALGVVVAGFLSRIGQDGKCLIQKLFFGTKGGLVGTDGICALDVQSDQGFKVGVLDGAAGGVGRNAQKGVIIRLPNGTRPLAIAFFGPFWCHRIVPGQIPPGHFSTKRGAKTRFSPACAESYSSFRAVFQ
jgi:hypothetical protein